MAAHQLPYSIVDPSIVEDPAMVLAHTASGTSVVASFVLAGGVLSGKYLSGVGAGSRASYITEMKAQYLNEETRRTVERLLEIANEKGISLSQLSLAWMLHKQSELGVTIVPIIGITKPSYLDDDLASLEVKLSSSDIKNLEEIATTAKMGPLSY